MRGRFGGNSNENRCFDRFGFDRVEDFGLGAVARGSVFQWKIISASMVLAENKTNNRKK
jgi:hypothetical protein